MLFLTSKVRLHCDRQHDETCAGELGDLFLTSKVRLHCDGADEGVGGVFVPAFPDLKGQAPLRPCADRQQMDGVGLLFLTSKVRLHCDRYVSCGSQVIATAFPDLKGQAPLRPPRG